MKTLGFDKPLYILPFDHRGSFQKKMFGWNGALSPQQTEEIAAAKRVIYDAFCAAIAAGFPKTKQEFLSTNSSAPRFFATPMRLNFTQLSDQFNHFALAEIARKFPGRPFSSVSSL